MPSRNITPSALSNIHILYISFTRNLLRFPFRPPIASSPSSTCGQNVALYLSAPYHPDPADCSGTPLQKVLYNPTFRHRNACHPRFICRAMRDLASNPGNSLKDGPANPLFL
ncbi:uncharacterized protein K444DRAFT_282303 [Hyaloscypha bicolor E]|uniref:Uncharacterized protein n=1 Tax=Hyaloscypha bicolor E TaxID=1095630 RepID=A0A2J6SG34_9HELO|nr:uncharacterized protein K444DRAFT_282303 [Hyaloscypha bicolor E]PMD49738.1 hypothetical protein K444DRAFT_282303 [Hyaloscypha bicolor E]